MRILAGDHAVARTIGLTVAGAELTRRGGVPASVQRGALDRIRGPVALPIRMAFPSRETARASTTEKDL